jgi:hypothetical protein
VKIFLLINFIFAQTVLPGQFQEVNVCYEKQGEVISESFLAPVVAPDTGPVQFIALSPIDSGRQLNDIPSFGLAKWHWWLFAQQLFRAQRQYAGCVERIKQSQRFLGLSPLVDEPGSPVRDIIVAVREYEVPFDPVQNTSNKNLPPSREIAIAHIQAAIAGVNLTVLHINACNEFANWIEKQVKKKIK